MSAQKNTYADKSQAELTEVEQTLRKELFDLRFQHATRKLPNPSEIKAKRREIARVLTARARLQVR
jgi:large subunit ribosomal protein L29